jgi:hypothetical protein
MIDDAHTKIRQTNQKTLTLWGFSNGEKSPKINSNAANNFSSDIG